MTKIELAKKQVEAAEKRLKDVYSDVYSVPSIQQFEKVWAEHGTGSDQAERLEFVAKREEARITREVEDAKRDLVRAEMHLRLALAEAEQT